MTKSPKTFPIGRNSITGRLESVQQAKTHPATSTIERMPKPGRGDTKGDGKK